MNIRDIDFQYLVLQHGKVSDSAHDRFLWEEKYERSLFEIYLSIKNFLPSNITNFVDIGSGLGGIDALLIQEHYPADTFVYLLDGMRDQPEHIKADQTFNNMIIAMQFLQNNGVKNSYGLDPESCNKSVGEAYLPDFKTDLIMSFASYCFHYPPKEYINFVKKVASEDATLIFDVRSGKPEWVQEIIDAGFAPTAVAFRAPKYDRMVFKRR